MTPSIPSHSVARVKEAADLGIVAASYLRLRPAGADSLSAKCPWHGGGKERTSSLFIHPRRGFYKCFSCSATGDSITFVQRMEGLSFPVAVRTLADRFGVVLDESNRSHREEKVHRESAAKLANEVHWFWSQVRMALALYQNELVAVEKRAEAWLAARVDAPDSPAMEYAWFWMAQAPVLYELAALNIDTIDGAKPDSLRDIYLGVRGKVRPRYEAERRLWGGLSESMVARIKAWEGERLTVSGPGLPVWAQEIRETAAQMREEHARGGGA